MSWVHGGAALLYLVVFGLMCLKVKEGQYPPVTDVTEHTSVWEQIKIYMKECFSHPIYVFIFLGTGLFGISTLVTLGADVFAIKAMGVSMKGLGLLTLVASGMATLIMYPCGWLSDKFHPLRVTLASVILVAVVNFLSCFFMVGPVTYWVFTIIAVLLNGVYFAAGIPMLMALLPKSRFGQFCSANGTFKSAVLVVFGLFTGGFLDWLTNNGKLVDNYRYGFLCVGVCFVLYAITLVYVMKYWKQSGGMHGYIAPGVDEPGAAPALDSAATSKQE
jgi:maltose/moltooligosaccharide transporter